jgi:cysteine desulfurase
LLLLRQDIAERIQPLLTGGQQENGLRAGTESPVLAQGMAAAFHDIGPSQANQVEISGSGIAPVRDALLTLLCQTHGFRLSGHPRERLPHHISVLVSDRHGQPMSGRALVRARDSDSPILEAMGVDPLWRRSGLRLSLGYWINPSSVPEISDRLQKAIERMNQTV